MPAEVAVRATREALAEYPGVEEARFWLFSQPVHDAFAAALGLD